MEVYTYSIRIICFSWITSSVKAFIDIYRTYKMPVVRLLQERWGKKKPTVNKLAKFVMKCLFNVAVFWICCFSNPRQVLMTTLLVETLACDPHFSVSNAFITHKPLVFNGLRIIGPSLWLNTSESRKTVKVSSLNFTLNARISLDREVTGT